MARIAALTHRGALRPDNEDCAYAGGRRLSGEMPAAQVWQSQPPLLAMVADGLGGHAAGEVASRLAIEAMLAAFARPLDASAVAQAIIATNGALFAAMAEGKGAPGMGTTLAGCWLDGQGGGLGFHVGDSRLYRWRGARLERLTEDDSMTASYTGGRRLPFLTQCLGGANEPVAITPHVQALGVQPGDRLMLCSDGLTDMIEDDILAAVMAAGGPLAPLADRLSQAAMAAGGADNITVILVEAD